jgi:hypothetical protein
VRVRRREAPPSQVWYLTNCVFCAVSCGRRGQTFSGGETLVTETLRWAALNNLYLDFFWMALQAVEKHLKAILLFNGKRAVSHRHEHRPDHAMILRNAILWSHANITNLLRASDQPVNGRVLYAPCEVRNLCSHPPLVRIYPRQTRRRNTSRRTFRERPRRRAASPTTE